jgi:SAM-dependent methyltransferase
MAQTKMAAGLPPERMPMDAAMPGREDGQIAQYRQLHAEKADYGASSPKYIDETSLFIGWLKPKSVLDYGCGKGGLLKALALRFPDIQFAGYDPAIPGADTLPRQKFDMAICTDVLEHIPEDALPRVVQEIASLSENCFFGLHHALARQILPNGQNAHCTIRPPVWYHRLLSQAFPQVFLLDGRGKEGILSVAATFPITPMLAKEYYEIIGKPLDDSPWKRFARKMQKHKQHWKRMLGL